MEILKQLAGKLSQKKEANSLSGAPSVTRLATAAAIATALLGSTETSEAKNAPLPWINIEATGDDIVVENTNKNGQPESATVTMDEDGKVLVQITETGDCPEDPDEIMQVETDHGDVEVYCIEGTGANSSVHYRMATVTDVNNDTKMNFTVDGEKLELDVDVKKKALTSETGVTKEKFKELGEEVEDLGDNTADFSAHIGAVASVTQADTFDMSVGFDAIPGGFVEDEANWMAGGEYALRLSYIPTVPVNGESTNVTVITNSVLARGGVDLPLGAGFHFNAFIGLGVANSAWARTTISPNVVANAGSRLSFMGNGEAGLELELGTPSFMLGFEVDGTVSEGPSFAGAENANSFPSAAPVESTTKVNGSLGLGGHLRGVF